MAGLVLFRIETQTLPLPTGDYVLVDDNGRPIKYEDRVPVLIEKKTGILELMDNASIAYPRVFGDGGVLSRMAAESANPILCMILSNSIPKVIRHPNPEVKITPRQAVEIFVRECMLRGVSLCWWPSSEPKKVSPWVVQMLYYGLLKYASGMTSPEQE